MSNYNFNNMLKIINKYNIILIDINNLNNLRKLRNKVHIYSIKEAKNTDYNLFNIKEFNLMKNILKEIILNKKVTNNKKNTYIKKYFNY